MQKRTLGEAIEAENGDIIDDRSLALKNQVGDDLTRGWSMHYAVAAEAIGKKEAGYIRDRPENGMMVRGHLVKTRPGSLGIDGKVFKDRDAVGSMGQYLFYE